jgi:hypothetical protein
VGQSKRSWMPPVIARLNHDKWIFLIVIKAND